MRAVVTIALRVSGAREATAPATWGQKLIWDCLHHKGPDDVRFHDGGIAPVPHGRDLAAVIDAVTAFLSLHDTFRTTCRWRAGRLWQHVAGSGEVPMPVWEAPAEAAEKTAHALVDTLRSTPSAVWRDWPVRFALVVADGVPRYLSVVYHRMALDREGVRLVIDHMGRLLRGERGLRVLTQPVEQAMRECSSSGRAASAGMAAGLRAELAAAPPSSCDFPARPTSGERFARLRMWSSAASLATEGIAARSRVSSSAVLLAALGVALRCYTGHTDMMLCVSVENRGRQDHQGLVGTVTVETPVRFDLGATRWDELLKRAFEVSVQAHLAGAGCDPDQVNAARRALTLVQGGHLDWGTYFNDARQGPPVTVRESPDQLTARMADTAIEPYDGWARTDLRCQLAAYGAPGDMELSLWCDTWYIPEPAMRQILRGMERLLVTAYDRPVAAAELHEVTGIAPVRRAATAVRHVRGGWVDVSAARRLWREAAGAPAVLFADTVDSSGACRLLACWAGEPRPAEDLHRQFVAMLGDRTDIRAADRYLRCDRPPEDLDDLEQWRRMPGIESSDGRRT